MACVLLSTLEHVPPGTYLHNKTEEWELSSDMPLDFWATSDAVYDGALPGRIGSFVYPEDVRFRLKKKHVTHGDDFRATLRNERDTVRTAHDITVKNRTVVAQPYPGVDEFVANEDAGADIVADLEEDDGDNEEEEQEVDGTTFHELESDDDTVE